MISIRIQILKYFRYLIIIKAIILLVSPLAITIINTPIIIATKIIALVAWIQVNKIKILVIVINVLFMTVWILILFLKSVKMTFSLILIVISLLVYFLIKYYLL